MKAYFSLMVLAGCIGATVCFGGVAEPKAAGKAVWLTSLAEAKTEAAKRKVPILADFSGSDWCGWCMKLDEEVFSTPAFKKYASENLVLLLVDFPRDKPQTAEVKKQNSGLSDQFEIKGFPTVLLLNADGKLLARTGYQQGGAENYIKNLKKLLENNNRRYRRNNDVYMEWLRVCL